MLQVVLEAEIDIFDAYLNVVKYPGANILNEGISFGLLLSLFENFFLLNHEFELLQKKLRVCHICFLLRLWIPLGHFLDLNQSEHIFDVNNHGRLEIVPERYLDEYSTNLTIVQLKRHRTIVEHGALQLHVI